MIPAPSQSATTQSRPSLVLPRVEAPRLDDISVTVPAPEGFTTADLEARFIELAREHAVLRDRDPLELVDEGDDVCCDIIGYSRGMLIPFSVRTGAWLSLEPEPLLPGFYESLVGKPVGSRVEVELTLPEEYPVESLQGQPATFVVDIKGAREVQMPGFDDPQFLAAFGRGNTLDEAMESVARQMEEEEVQVLLLQAQRSVLNEVVARTPVEISEEVIDEEIRRRWNETEGETLAQKRMRKEDRLAALDLWLFDPEVRDEAEAQLILGVALRAICERDGIRLTREDVERVLRDESEASGVPMEEILASLSERPDVGGRIDQVAMHLKVVDHVMRQAKVHFEGADA
jgi:trigger factor